MVAPLGELRKIIKHFLIVGAEVMRAIFMHQQPIFIIKIKTIATNVVSLFHYEDFSIKPACYPFRQDTSREPGTYYQKIKHWAS
jgi:hypothetical protein